MGLIPCRKPKSNDNGIYEREIEREREIMEARVFKWFGYVSLRPHDVAQWATSLLIHCVQYIFDYYNML